MHITEGIVRLHMQVLRNGLEILFVFRHDKTASEWIVNVQVSMAVFMLDAILCRRFMSSVMWHFVSGQLVSVFKRSCFLRFHGQNYSSKIPSECHNSQCPGQDLNWSYVYEPGVLSTKPVTIEYVELPFVIPHTFLMWCPFSSVHCASSVEVKLKLVMWTAVIFWSFEKYWYIK
jgi:hypothetical protein